MRILAAVAFVGLLSFGHATEIRKPETETYSGVVDTVVVNVIATLRDILSNLTIPDIKETLTHQNMNVSFELTNVSLRGADAFENPVLKTSLIPIEIKNLTLTWEEVSVEANYYFDGYVDADQLQGPTHVHGKGKGWFYARNVYLTSGVKFRLTGEGLEVMPKGLYNFNFGVRDTIVMLESLMGSDELGEVVGTFFGGFIPGLIDSVKGPLFEIFHDDIVNLLNSFIRGG